MGLGLRAQRGDFAHAGEGAAEMRDDDGAADYERDIERVDHFLARPAGFAALDQVIGDAVVAAEDGGSDEAEQFLRLAE